MLITRMVLVANRHGHELHISTQDEDWLATPLFDEVWYSVGSFNYLNTKALSPSAGRSKRMITTAGFGSSPPSSLYCVDSILQISRRL